MTEQDFSKASPEDASELAEMVRELAASEGKRNTGELSAEKVADWLCQDPPAFEALLAGPPRNRQGYIAFYRAFSLFRGGPVLLVENLYIRPSARGSGLGRQLLKQASAHAVAQGIDRVELNVRSNNPDTIAFYQRCGFHPPGEEVFRIEGAALRDFAGKDTDS
ncbi:GNAT family N-acetyltransferase [Fodinicurvata halophila]|uniref:GNAT family N-acetyltransferase n=1 Tax=Fodinicurvata halophila TaxID=1419723 RepID=A0ABV8UKX8_9PROT